MLVLLCKYYNYRTVAKVLSTPGMWKLLGWPWLTHFVVLVGLKHAWTWSSVFSFCVRWAWSTCQLLRYFCCPSAYVWLNNELWKWLGVRQLLCRFSWLLNWTLNSFEMGKWYIVVMSQLCCKGHDALCWLVIVSGAISLHLGPQMMQYHRWPVCDFVLTSFDLINKAKAEWENYFLWSVVWS